MVILIAKSTLLPSKQDEFIKIAEKLVLETRKEPGCIYYDLVQDAEKDTIFYFIEKYQDEAAVQAHKESIHFRTYVPMLNAFRVGSSEITKCVAIDF